VSKRRPTLTAAHTGNAKSAAQAAIGISSKSSCWQWQTHHWFSSSALSYRMERHGYHFQPHTLNAIKFIAIL